MAYEPINLGDILQQVGAIKGLQQRQQYGALQLKQAQDQEAQSSALDQVLKNNPNAASADLIKAGGASAIPIAAQQQQLVAKADEQTYRQMYASASEAMVAKDPIAFIKAKHPEFIQQYDAQSGAPGTFDKLTPDQVRQMAAGIRDHAQQLLVDPKTVFQVQHEDQRAANTQAGEVARQRTNIAAENARAAASRAVTMRGQDLEQGRAGIPAGYERDPNTPGALRPIAGGPHDPNAVSAGMDSRSSVMFNRVAASANEAVQALKNIAELPVTTSTGWFGGAQPATTLMGSVKSVLGQKITSQEAQDYKTMIAGVSRSLSTIETAGLAPNGSITHSMDSITLNEGDSQLTKLRKLAETRQIIEKGIEPNLSNPKLAPAQRELINKIVSEVQSAIPFTQHDITKLQQSKNPNATLMDFAKSTGLPSQAPAGAHPAPIQALLDKYK